MTLYPSRTIRHIVVSAVLFTMSATTLALADEGKPVSPRDDSDIVSTSTLLPGQRVRVAAASPAFTGVLVGTLVKIDADTLTLVDAEHNLVSELPRNSVTRLEVGRVRRQTRKWFLIGAAVGGLAVFGAPVSTQLCGYNPETGTFERDCTTGEIAPAALAGAAVWGGIGAFIGHRRKTEDWTDAPLQDWQPAPSALSWRVSPTLSHEARGAGLRLQLSW